MPRKPKSASKGKGKRPEKRTKGVTVKNRRNKGRTGRPCLFHPGMANAAKAMAENGAFRSEIAAALGISYQTLRNWENTIPEFFEALNVDEVVATRNVERSLLQRATGFEYAAEKVFQYRGEIIRAPVIELVPPDPNAAMKWLTNRAPDRWQDRSSQSVEHKLSFSDAFEQYLAEVHGKPAPALEVEAVLVKGDGDD